MYKILVEMPAATTQYQAEFPLDKSSGKSSVVKITYCSWESNTNVIAGSDTAVRNKASISVYWNWTSSLGKITALGQPIRMCVIGLGWLNIAFPHLAAAKSLNTKVASQ